MFLFLLFFVSIYLLMIFYVYKRYIKKLTFSPLYKKIVLYLLVLTAVLAIFYIPVKKLDLIGGVWVELFALAVGAGFIFFALTVAYEFFRLFIKKQKHLFLADIATVLLAITVILYSFFEAVRDPKVVEIEIVSSKIDKPFKIAHLSDLHLGNSIFLDEGFALDVANMVSRQNVDLVAITGDLVDAPLEKVKRSLDLIATTHSKHGIYYVLGNHEYLYDTLDLIEYLKSLGIVVLENSNQTVTESITVAGIYDLFGERIGKLPPDSNKAFEGVEDDEFVIFLTHQPKGKVDRADLTLSGHTHGGQIFPFGALVKLDQPYIAGLNVEKTVYVNRGTGFWGPPLRLFAPSEIAIITLKGD